MIWLIGNKGMLGREIGEQFAAAGIPVIASDREVDIADMSAIEKFASAHNPEWIVNCAAYTAVDQAESEEDIAAVINSDGPANLAGYAAKTGAKLIHLSTDYVFDGAKRSPYTEDDKPNPQSAYGRTKLDGERRIIDALPRHFIIRTAWLYGPYGKNFAATMLRLFSERSEVRVVDDQSGTPTYSLGLARNIVDMVHSDSDKYGIFHYTDDGETTWYEFAREIYTIARGLGMLAKEVEILPVTTLEYPTAAKRPQYSVLSKDKIIRELGFTVADWKTNLRAYLERV